MQKHSFWSSRFLYRILELTIPSSRLDGSFALHPLNTHRAFLLSLLSPGFCLVAGVILFDLSTPPRGVAVSFLPDDAIVACRAILPQCFRRDDWAALCADDPSIVAGHPEACRSAGFEPDHTPQGR